MNDNFSDTKVRRRSTTPPPRPKLIVAASSVVGSDRIFCVNGAYEPIATVKRVMHRIEIVTKSGKTARLDPEQQVSVRR